MKLGSLFDGSGGFPLAGSLCGITPVFASEVEPYPISVTKSKFPQMRHYGDISKINGADIEPVDIITFGSPCQDLSVAGKRAGLKHEDNGDGETTRSGLFMEAVRIIKEMREATNGKYPTFALWENVPGAFSSNKGDDFRVVLEELIKIIEPEAKMPAADKKGWSYADCYVGDGWSVAYRTLDAQYWGVPQRRRRIYLVADFRGERAGKILFERKGLRWHLETSRAERKDITADAQGSSCADERQRDNLIAIATQQGGAEISENGVCPTVTAAAGMSGNNQPWICAPYAFTQNQRDELRELGDKSGCLQAESGMKQQTFIIDQIGGQGEYYQESPVSSTLRAGGQGAICCMTTGSYMQITEHTSPTLMARDYKDAPVVYCLQGNGIDRADTAGCNGKGWRENESYTLNTIDRPAVAYTVDQGGGKSSCIVTEEKSPTLTCTNDGAPAVAYLASGNDVAGCLMASGYNKLGAQEMFSGDYTVIEEQPAASYWDGTQTVGTLTANNAGGSQRMPDKENFNCVIEERCGAGLNGEKISRTLIARMTTATGTTQDNLIVSDYRDTSRYIVRRLTPTECARLQGFPDKWGHPDEKENLTDEEYKFWLEVRNTHATINGKATKEHTKEQMLRWYNKLHTDSSEYKMWGNGIALPTALYVMQGIADELQKQ